MLQQLKVFIWNKSASNVPLWRGYGSYTLEDFDSRTLGCFTSKIAIFKWSWQRVKVLPRPGSYLVPFRLD